MSVVEPRLDKRGAAASWHNMERGALGGRWLDGMIVMRLHSCTGCLFSRCCKARCSTSRTVLVPSTCDAGSSRVVVLRLAITNNRGSVFVSTEPWLELCLCGCWPSSMTESDRSRKRCNPYARFDACRAAQTPFDGLSVEHGTERESDLCWRYQGPDGVIVRL